MIAAETFTPDVSAPQAFAALTQAFAGRAEVEFRPEADGIALVLKPAALKRPPWSVPLGSPDGSPAVSQAVSPDGSLAVRAKAEFLEELTRETRSGVTMILHAIEMAMEASEPGENLPWVETVGEAARALMRRVDSLVEFGAPDRRLRPQLVTFNPMSLLRDVMEGAVPRAGERGVSLEAAVYGELPERVQGDATALRRVMRLLLSHAVEESRSAADWALHFEPGKETHRVRLEVGYDQTLEPAFVAWLTRPSASPEAAEMPEGETAANLGLVRRLVEEEMSGRFTIAREGESGTRFRCEMTWQPGEVAAPEPYTVKLSGASVLAVTPDKSLRKVLQMRYAALGLRTMTVDTVDEAKRLLEQAAPEAFDMVLAEYRRGETLEFAQWLAANTRWSRLPRLTISMAGEPGQAATAEEAGYQGYLTPPLPLELVRDACTVLLARSAAGTRGDLVTRFSLAEAADARPGSTGPSRG